MGNKVKTICPYCASGCEILLTVENGEIICAEPGQGRNNQGELCLKGYYGWDFLKNNKHITARVTKPMIRRVRGAEFEEVSWAEAIAFAAMRLQAVKKQYGPDSIMCTGAARGPGNEANYVMQKFARAAVGTNNIDHCARVCHGSSVSGLELSLGNGAMSNYIPEIEDTKCVFIFGYNPAVTHPIVARRILKAKDKGATIITADPRFSEQAKISDLWLPLKNGTNMALVNAMAYVLLTENLYKKDYVENYTEGFAAYAKIVMEYSPESVEALVGISAKDIRTAARMYAAASSATILWGMGVTQFGQAVDVALRNLRVKLVTRLRALQMPVHFAALNRRILHLAGLDLVQQIGVPDFRGLAPHASPALHYHVQHHQAHEYEHPQDDRLDRRIHQDPSFPAGENPRLLDLRLRPPHP